MKIFSLKVFLSLSWRRQMFHRAWKSSKMLFFVFFGIPSITSIRFWEFFLSFSFVSFLSTFLLSTDHVECERGKRRRAFVRIYADEILLVTHFFRLCWFFSFMLCQYFARRQRKRESWLVRFPSSTRKEKRREQQTRKNNIVTRGWNLFWRKRLFRGKQNVLVTSSWLLNIITH